MTIQAAQPQTIARAVDLLRAGELVAMPTETVYGLGADALNPKAVAKIFAAKGRPTDHPLIVHLPDAGHLTRWAARIPKDAIALAQAFWPGPLTLILPRDDSVPDEVTGAQDTVGLRVPNHPVALALLRAFDSGIAAPSANRFGRISPTTAAHVESELGDRVAMILDGGPCAVGIESTILDLSRDRPAILRPGAISAADIARVIGRMPVEPQRHGDTGQGVATCATNFAAATPRVAGSHAAHYAPRTPLKLVAAASLHAAVLTLVSRGQRVAVLTHHSALAREPGDDRCVLRTAPADATAFAHDLYANLRELDAIGADLIIIEAPATTPDWDALRDRLQRATVGSGADADV